MADEIFSSSHPLLPPTTEDDQVAWLRLLRSYRVGLSTFYRLMATYGSAQAALAALPQVAADAGLQNYTAFSEDAARTEMAAGKKHAAKLIFRGAPDYPLSFDELTDAPPFLWALGDLALLQRPKIALVGARNASSLGLRMTKLMAADLGAKGFVVVSGLARGIDAAAHTAALETGTVAVQAGGVDFKYPAENAELWKDIRRAGLLLSEQPIGLPPKARHFPIRNRLISGLAQQVVVIEAAGKSGSLITAKTALDQGRDVLAVPGHPFDARASGCNLLIRDGATLVRSAQDVIDAIGPVALQTIKPPQRQVPDRTAPKPRTLQQTAKLHQLILDRLGPSPLAEDQLIRDLRANSADFSAALVELEIARKVQRQPGGMVALDQPLGGPKTC